MDLLKHFNLKNPQVSEPIADRNMVKNNTDGFVFKIDPWSQFKRFLILGSEGGTYYVSESKLTKENATNTIHCIQQDGLRAVQEILTVSLGGKAPKNDAAIFSLALCCTFGDPKTKQESYHSIEQVCRTGTHLFTFCQAIQNLRGWSRGLRNGVSQFYLNRDTKNLAYQLIKYRQRNGWTHRDVLRLCHANSPSHNELLKWVVGKGSTENAYLNAFDELQKTENANTAIHLIETHQFPWEAVPTHLLKEKKVWESLYDKLPLTALLRNLGRLSYLGLFDRFSNFTTQTVSKFTDKEYLKKSRLHPLSLLMALKTYSQERGEKGSLTWNANAKIIDALNSAFYMTFDNVMPTNKNILLCLDVSGSMACSSVAGMSSLTPREVTAALALIHEKLEPNCAIMGFSNTFMDLKISGKQRLDDVMKYMDGLNFSSTDVSIPIRWAIENQKSVHGFFIYTDNEVNCGEHPSVLLKNYRNLGVTDSKMAVIAMTSTHFSVADPEDPGMMDIVGFDPSTPQIISNFLLG